MLRQALDAAEGQALAAEPAHDPTEETPLLLEQKNGSTASDDDESLQQSYDDDEEEEYLFNAWNNDEEEENEATSSLLTRLGRAIKNAFLIIANVENLWDESPNEASSSLARREQTRRNHLIVLFWFVVLAASYAGERSTFKLLVDKTGPFRLFAVEMVTLSHAFMLAISMLSAYLFRYSQNLPLGIPLVDVGLMGLLDTSSLMLVFLTGYYTPPTLTVILVQFQLPLTAFLTQFVHPDGKFSCCQPTVSVEPTVEQSRRDSPGRNAAPPPPPSDDYSVQEDRGNGTHEFNTGHSHVESVPLPGWGGLTREHLWGSLIIFVAVLLALLPAVYCILNPEFFIYADTIPIRTAYNTLLFVSSCIPAAASQLYKEYIFLQYKQPVNRDLLNLLLSWFQFVFASLLSPLAFGLQGLGARKKWMSLYPSDMFSQNFLDGLFCFFGLLSDEYQENKYPEDARCDFTLGLVLLHAVSIIAVGVAVDKIVNAGATKVMYRGISAGIIVAVLCMHVYDMHIPEFNYGPAIDGLNLVCLILLILGSEVYHRATLQETIFETVYPKIEPLYDDE